MPRAGGTGLRGGSRAAGEQRRQKVQCGGRWGGEKEAGGTEAGKAERSPSQVHTGPGRGAPGSRPKPLGVSPERSCWGAGRRDPSKAAAGAGARTEPALPAPPESPRARSVQLEPPPPTRSARTVPVRRPRAEAAAVSSSAGRRAGGGSARHHPRRLPRAEGAADTRGWTRGLQGVGVGGRHGPPGSAAGALHPRAPLRCQVRRLQLWVLRAVRSPEFAGVSAPGSSSDGRRKRGVGSLRGSGSLPPRC